MFNINADAVTRKNSLQRIVKIKSDLAIIASKTGEDCKLIYNKQENEVTCTLVVKSKNKRGYDFCGLKVRDEIPTCYLQKSKGSELFRIL